MKKFLLALFALSCMAAVASPVKSMLAVKETEITSYGLPEGVVPVEYLETTGTQYIDTGYYASNYSVFRTTLTPISHRVNGMSFFGATVRDGRLGAGDQVVLTDRYSYVGQLAFYATWSIRMQTIPFNYGDTLNIVADVSAQSLTVNGMTVMFKQEPLDSRAQYPIFIGGTNLAGTLFRGSNCRYCFWSVEEDGRALRFLIPVRVDGEDGYPVGAMYDLVSGDLFYNAGTGDFLIGPDKED